ncbi:hypothetical protein HSB1_21710 [Halogranum salarium B-1]|uniref:Uncharacterized protein n=1 Tax=Halogranum salarium B-1 TaxID=1210908 RepID=J3A3N1_9EURY|nr:hypothetical protein HSB1_21710 [Halogranum salarium B-1]
MIAALVVVLGVLVAVLPLVSLPESSGPMAFLISAVQVVAGVVGVAVAIAGVYSYRTGNPQAAVAAGLMIVGFVAVGAVGGLVETSGGPLVPIWVWMVSILVVVLGSLAVSDRVGDGGE